jgi:GTPase
VEDDGTPLGLCPEEVHETLMTLFFMGRCLNAQLLVEEVRPGIEGELCRVEVRRNEIEGIKVDIKISMLGGEGAGKSTLIGVLISGQKDNGRGLARTNVFRHKHEVMNGRTSSISQQILGFDAMGKVTNQSRFG